MIPTWIFIASWFAGIIIVACVIGMVDEKNVKIREEDECGTSI